MRSYYLSSGKNLNFDIKGQIRELNTKVIEWCATEIITNIEQYNEYKKSVSTLKMPMENPLMTSQRGLKSQEFSYF